MPGQLGTRALARPLVAVAHPVGPVQMAWPETLEPLARVPLVAVQARPGAREQMAPPGTLAMPGLVLQAGARALPVGQALRAMLALPVPLEQEPLQAAQDRPVGPVLTVWPETPERLAQALQTAAQALPGARARRATLALQATQEQARPLVAAGLPAMLARRVMQGQRARQERAQRLAIPARRTLALLVAQDRPRLQPLRMPPRCGRSNRSR